MQTHPDRSIATRGRFIRSANRVSSWLELAVKLTNDGRLASAVAPKLCDAVAAPCSMVLRSVTVSSIIFGCEYRTSSSVELTEVAICVIQ